MVVILKDHKKDPIRIDAIPTKKLDMIEEWLSEIRKTYVLATTHSTSAVYSQTHSYPGTPRVV